ncbi:MAG: tail fiber domain-containing protein, partial [Verrucomicrobia subdivision 3 bacterium]|nr:tail fiber domain-containing protein [Limisphaerales bacterium]
MQTKFNLLAMLLASLCITDSAHAQNTVITYQGRVTSHGTNFTGTGQFKFALVTATNIETTAKAEAITSGGFVTIINLISGGNGYITAPTVTIAGGGGSGATATASISGGVVTAITVNNPGSAYTSTPDVTVAAPPETFAYTSYWSNDGTSSAGSEPTAGVDASVADGLFTARLGDGTLANMTALPPGLFTQPNLKLRIWFNDGVNGFGVLHPAQPLTAAPYSLVAGTAGSASNLLGTLGTANLGGTYGNVVTFNNAGNNFSGNGAGLTALNASQLTTGTVPDARLSANVSLLGNSIASAEITDGTIAAADVNAANFNTTFWRTAGNAGTTPGTHSVGTTDNQPLEFKVNNQRGLRLEPTASTDTVNVIGGSARNFVGAGVVGATIGGGGSGSFIGSARTNSVWADYGVVGGGLANTIAANAPTATIAGGGFNDIGIYSDYSVVGGGQNNDILANATYATIAGGIANSIGTNSFASAIGGGSDNDIAASAQYATIAGGINNDIVANAQYATIPGGLLNTATNYAFAAGRRAKANHTGAFVWADSQNADFASTTNNQFAIRATGGVQLSDNTPALSFGFATRQMLNLWGTDYGLGVQSFGYYFRAPVGANFYWYRAGTHDNNQGNAGGGAQLMRLDSNGNLVLSIGGYFPVSDRNVKENFSAINPLEVLAKVAALPISGWNYKTDATSKHIGPVAQDFYASFGLGIDDKHIATVDADGVALAAIQGLNQKLEETRAENSTLKERVEKLEKLLQKF